MNKNIWEALWDYNPNGLLVIDENFDIQIVNPSLIDYFALNNSDIIGKKVTDFFSDIEDFIRISLDEEDFVQEVKEYENLNLCFSQVTFKVGKKGLIAKVFHRVEAPNKEFENIKYEIAKDIKTMVENQTKTVQEVASLLGKTTGDTHVSLKNLLTLLENER